MVGVEEEEVGVTHYHSLSEAWKGEGEEEEGEVDLA